MAVTPRKSFYPVLEFSAFAWAKLQYFLHVTQNEVGCMGIADDPKDPLFITDLLIPKQEVSMGSTKFDVDDLAARYEKLIEAGYTFGQFARVWIHTHPTGVHAPSGTDWTTFDEDFSEFDWAVMAIFAKDGWKFARLRYPDINGRPGVDVDIPVQVQEFLATKNSLAYVTDDGQVAVVETPQPTWVEEYKECLQTRPSITYIGSASQVSRASDWRPTWMTGNLGDHSRWDPDDADFKKRQEEWQKESARRKALDDEREARWRHAFSQMEAEGDDDNKLQAEFDAIIERNRRPTPDPDTPSEVRVNKTDSEHNKPTTPTHQEWEDWHKYQREAAGLHDASDLDDVVDVPDGDTGVDLDSKPDPNHD